MRAIMSLDEEREDLRFGVEKSIRYHSRMAGRYRAIHRFLMFLTIVSGSAAFADAASISHIWGLSAAVIAAFSLVYAPGDTAARHRNLRNRFSDLEISIEVEHDADLSLLKERRLRIEQDEPPVFWALESDCYNEVCLAWGRDKGFTKIPRWQRLTMYFLRHERVS